MRECECDFWEKVKIGWHELEATSMQCLCVFFSFVLNRGVWFPSIP